MDIEVGIGTEVLDLINSWLQLSVLENGRRVVRQVEGHG